MRKKRNKKNSLAGTPEAMQSDERPILWQTMDSFLVIATAIVSGGAGAAIGKYSLLGSIPVTLAGMYYKNKYVTAIGLGLACSNGFQKSAQAQVATTTEGMDGFKEIAQQAKERVGTFFENFKEKLFIPTSTPASHPATTEGLGENEQVTYFINPYQGTGELDMSAIDRVQEQIARITKNEGGLNEVDREF